MFSFTAVSEQVAFVSVTMDKVVRANRNNICKIRGINGLIVEKIQIFKHTFIPS